MTHIIFETFISSTFYVAIQAVLSLYASGIVIDLADRDLTEGIMKCDAIGPVGIASVIHPVGNAVIFLFFLFLLFFFSDFANIFHIYRCD